jgi:hypothetical protein
MLEPHSRTLLFDILRPPDDHALDCGIATTYTLDLLALLTAPAAFSLFEADDPAELLKLNSLTLLESLRRYADRLTVFNQAGLIALPKVPFPQFEFLERVVVECRARVPGARFHPKVFVLRFVGPKSSVRYRFACLSRNLTFDRCWDTVLTLEGALVDRRNGFAANHPLADFVAALPELCVRRPVPDVLQERIARIESEVRRVAFEVPEGFDTDAYHFHPLGLNGTRALPFDRVPGRMLAISPFVSSEGVQRLFKGRSGSQLVSRAESLADNECRAPEIERYYVIPDVVESEGSVETEEEPPTARGLHAKCYIAEAGAKAHVWSGSANATAAGFNGNIEFLVELVGPKARFGIDALFEQGNGRTSFGNMLEEFIPPKESEATSHEEEERFAVDVDKVREALVGRAEATVATEESGYLLTLRWSEDARVPNDVCVDCRPVTLDVGHARTLLPDVESHSFLVSLESITSFIAIRVTQQRDGGQFEETFVLNVPLTGAPADRRDRLLRAVIQDRDRFARYLLLLLADEGFELTDQMIQNERRSANGDSAQHADQLGGLLESMLRTLDREPERLDHVARLVEDVNTQLDAQPLLPERFNEVWAPIWSARQRRRSA